MADKQKAEALSQQRGVERRRKHKNNKTSRQQGGISTRGYQQSTGD
jgi:hypothetical protein